MLHFLISRTAKAKDPEQAAEVLFRLCPVARCFLSVWFCGPYGSSRSLLGGVTGFISGDISWG